MNNELGVVVLAAGQGTRMRSVLPKVLHSLGGRPMLRHVLAVADALGSTQTVVVLAEDTVVRVREAMGDGYSYAVQAERLGTGHAVLQAQALLEGKTAQVLVLYGDTPLLRPATAASLVEAQRHGGAPVTMLSFIADPPTGYGRVLRDERGGVQGIVEERDADEAQRQIREVASGIFCFDANWLWSNLARLEPSPLNGEYYLTTLPELAVAEYGSAAVMAQLIVDTTEALGVNDRAQLATAEAALRQRTLGALLESGVTIVDPATTYVDVGVQVGRDTILLPGTMLRGATSIGERCVLGPYAQIIDTTIGAESRVSTALIEQVILPAQSYVAPYSVVQFGGRGHDVDSPFQ